MNYDNPIPDNIPGSLAYPDWNEETSWCLTGTFGGCRGRTSFEEARNFDSPDEARRYYENLYGKCLESFSSSDKANTGGRWGFRFRGQRPEKIPTGK